MNKSLALFLALCWIGTTNAASFDCAKARWGDRELVCGKQEVSDLDTQLGKIFVEGRGRICLRQRADAFCRINCGGCVRFVILVPTSNV